MADAERETTNLTEQREHETSGETPKKISRRKEKTKIKQKKGLRWFKRIICGLFIIACVLVIAVLVKVYPAYRELKETAYTKLMSIDESTFTKTGNTEIYDTSGKLIGRIGNEKYEYVEISDISPYLTSGYIAAEDKNFYTHSGIDIKATIRAGWALVKNKGNITQGGSTITMQVVKNNLLSQERTYERKILEMMLALQLERRYDKGKIMEFYCNTNYYGNGCYGVEGASRYYFGKSAKDLTLAEAAMLVGTSNSPNNYNPVVSYEKATKKKQEVVDSMLEQGLITQEERDQAVAENPEIVEYSENTIKENAMMTYALHCATLKLMESEDFEPTYTFESEQEYEAYQTLYQTLYNETYEKIKSGGYKIYTSLDKSLQKKLQKSIDSGLKDFKSKKDGVYEMQGAGVCMDNKTQMVVAIVGAREGKGSFNRGYQAKRQPGSAIKPLLDYGPAVDQGVIIPSTVIEDKKVDYNGYTPKNAGNSYSGNVTVRKALAKSINTVAVQVYDMVGKEEAMSYLDKLGFSSLTYTDQQTMSVAIGGFTLGVTVEDMARGYAVLANDGEMSGGGCILKIKDNAGETAYTRQTDKTQIYSADTAFMITDMLVGVFADADGTANKKQSDTQVYAGKTGTTNDKKDAWFCGYSKYYTTCIWTGYDTPQSVDGMYGSTYPLDIWSSYMDKIHEGLEKKEFTPTETIRLISGTASAKSPYSADIKTKEVTYTSDIHSSRPAGWDYISGEKIDELVRAQNERLQENEAAKLRQQVENFENLVVSDADDAKAAQSTYSELIEQVKTLDDVDVRAELTERLSYKYDLLEDEVLQKWNDIETFQSEYEIQAGEQNSALAAQKSAEETEEAYKKQLTENMNWYISTLKKCTLYTDATEDLIADGEDCLDMCEQLDNYVQLSAEFEQIKSYVRSLPTQTYSGVMPETPDPDDYSIE